MIEPISGTNMVKQIAKSRRNAVAVLCSLGADMIPGDQDVPQHTAPCIRVKLPSQQGWAIPGCLPLGIVDAGKAQHIGGAVDAPVCGVDLANPGVVHQFHMDGTGEGDALRNLTAIRPRKAMPGRILQGFGDKSGPNQASWSEPSVATGFWAGGSTASSPVCSFKSELGGRGASWVLSSVTGRGSAAAFPSVTGFWSDASL